MSVNYNDGKWQGWNGGDCPLHPETVVEVVLDNGSLVKGEFASRWFWDIDSTRIIAFRVIKEHKEPREFWIVDGGYMSHAGFDRMRDAYNCALVHGGKVIHVREVTE